MNDPIKSWLLHGLPTDIEREDLYDLAYGPGLGHTDFILQATKLA
jgi:hypothetical protein|tara:strand:- start:11 stop:145 length:135 start_codon:yes stop_codon:yes gene_type:complete